MKKSNTLILGITVAITALTLFACRNNTQEIADSYTDETGTYYDGVSAISGPTSAVGETSTALVEAMHESGAWVFGLQNDMTLDEPLYITGTFYQNMHGDDQMDFQRRKLAFYRRDADRQPIGAWRLTAPHGITVYSPYAGFYSDGVYNGYVVGDVTVHANNFSLIGVIIEGDLIFANESYLNSAEARQWNPTTANFETMSLENAVTGNVIVRD